MSIKPTNQKWDWIPCKYNLKLESSGKSQIWNLSPQIILTNQSGEGPDPYVKLYIDTEKSLNYSKELGWNWHKSWNLPNLSVKIEIKDVQTNELLLSPKNLYAHLFAVKAVLDQNDNFHLVDVGLRGTTKLELLDGHAFFSALKFSSTSYNNEGVKFHLVLSLYIMDDEDSNPKILNSTISPPIFVDSRKSARDSFILLEKKMSTFVDPFLPETLEKIFIKRENKRKNDMEIKINNDFDGLFNYLTAPNIRNKVKHPLFLCLKFSSSVKLFFHKDQIPENSNESIIQHLQTKLNEDLYSTNQSPPKNVSHNFLLLIEESIDSIKNKKIIEAVEPLQCQSVGLIYSQDQVNENYSELTYDENLVNAYKKCYPQLVTITTIGKQQRENESDGNDQSYSESKKRKTNRNLQESESEDEDNLKNIKSNMGTKKRKGNPDLNDEKNQNIKQNDSESNEEYNDKTELKLTKQNLAELPVNVFKGDSILDLQNYGDNNQMGNKQENDQNQLQNQMNLNYMNANNINQQKGNQLPQQQIQLLLNQLISQNSQNQQQQIQQTNDLGQQINNMIQSSMMPNSNSNDQSGDNNMIQKQIQQLMSQFSQNIKNPQQSKNQKINQRIPQPAATNIMQNNVINANKMQQEQQNFAQNNNNPISAMIYNLMNKQQINQQPQQVKQEKIQNNLQSTQLNQQGNIQNLLNTLMGGSNSNQNNNLLQNNPISQNNQDLNYQSNLLGQLINKLNPQGQQMQNQQQPQQQFLNQQQQIVPNINQQMLLNLFNQQQNKMAPQNIIEQPQNFNKDSSNPDYIFKMLLQQQQQQKPQSNSQQLLDDKQKQNFFLNQQQQQSSDLTNKGFNPQLLNQLLQNQASSNMNGDVSIQNKIQSLINNTAKQNPNNPVNCNQGSVPNSSNIQENLMSLMGQKNPNQNKYLDLLKKEENFK